MENVIYSKVVKGSNVEPKTDEPSCVIATREANGYAVFFKSDDEGTVLLKWIRQREAALEYAVDEAKRRLEKS